MLSGQAKRVGVVQPGGEKALGRPYSSLQYLKGPTAELERDFLEERIVIKQGVMALN